MAFDFSGTRHGDPVTGSRRPSGFLSGISQTMGKKSPILQAADIQAEALENAIPFLEPFLNLGRQGLERFASSSTVQGLGSVIDQILNTDAFQGLVDQRQESVTNQLSSVGLTRSGAAAEEAAAIPMDVAFEIENLLSGRQGGLAGLGLSGATGIADLTTRVGEAIASGILGLEAQRTARSAAKDTNRANILGAGLGALGSILSDPRLKTNVKTNGKIGPLTLVSWEWIDETKGTVVEGMQTFGFMADDVEKHFPQHVGEFGGYKTIDYPALITELKDGTSNS